MRSQRVGATCGQSLPNYKHELDVWRGARAVEWVGLENRCRGFPYRGFESLPLRHFFALPHMSQCVDNYFCYPSVVALRVSLMPYKVSFYLLNKLIVLAEQANRFGRCRHGIYV